MPSLPLLEAQQLQRPCPQVRTSCAAKELLRRSCFAHLSCFPLPGALRYGFNLFEGRRANRMDPPDETMSLPKDFPENSIKSLLARGNIRPSKLPPSRLFARQAAPMVREQSSGGSHVSAALVRVKELPARRPIVSRAGANSGERFGGRKRAFASPFVIFA